MIVYKATNKINGKKYVGQTSGTLKDRIKDHLKAAKRGSKYFFHKAIRKYGIDNFWWEIICDCYSQTDMNEQEAWFIEVFDAKVPYGYNLTDGGDGSNGYHHTEEAKRKISKAMSGKKHPMFGKKRPEHSEKMRGRKRPDVTERMRKRIGEKHPMFGKKNSGVSKSNRKRTREKNPNWHKC